MKISLITPVFNNASEIEETLHSVFSQDIPNLEYIVIDGGSTDGTLDILKKYSDKISILVSEKDKGLYHALNKGFSIASGDILGLIHSGDLFAQNDILKKIGSKFIESDIDVLYGDLVYVQKIQPSKIVRYWKSGNFSNGRLAWGWVPPHPSLFMKREHYQKLGPFNTDYKISADYDLMLRVLKDSDLKIHYLPEVLVRMRTGGKSNNSFKNLIDKSIEDWKIIRKNRSGHLHTLFFKKFSKISQYF
jgi:glycosyltransferase